MLLQGDAARIPLPDKSIHVCVTSPPFWGLRKYAGDQGRGTYPDLGLEPTPEEFVEHMVAIFREVRRVLRDDGVCWLNLGDCYASANARRVTETESAKAIERGKRLNYYNQPAGWTGRGDRAVMDIDIPQGNLMLMPHRVAIALQDDGWVVRNDVVWYKRNPMPESVRGWRWERSKTEIARLKGQAMQVANKGSEHLMGSPDKVIYEYGDDYVLRKGSWRHTRAHEYIFMLTKGMGYFCNQEAVRVPYQASSIARSEYPVAKISVEDAQGKFGKGIRGDPNRGKKVTPHSAGRNPRSVLDIPTASYSGSHYATYPPKLIAPLIRASCPRRCCPECGAPWAPVVERNRLARHELPKEDKRYRPARYDGKYGNVKGSSFGDDAGYTESSVKSYRPTCSCGHEPVPGIVLDPFGGSGTTGMVAKKLMRRWFVLDISREYLDQQAKVRTGSGSPSNALDDLPLFDGSVI